MVAEPFQQTLIHLRMPGHADLQIWVDFGNLGED
jgi:hypothetical protein